MSRHAVEPQSLSRRPLARLRAASGSARIGASIVTVLVIGAIWIVVTGWRARADLESLRHDVSRLRSDLVAGRTADVARDLANAQSKAAAARARTSGPAWWVGAHLPGLGSPLRTIRAIASTGHSLSQTALPSVVAGGTALDPQRLRIGPDRIDIGRLEEAEGPLGRALPAVSAARTRIAELSGSWLGPVADGRLSLLKQLTSFEGTLRDTAMATRLMPDMLGGDGPKTYLVVFEGNNEARALGGIFGGYGLLAADNGRLKFGRFGSDQDFQGVTARVDLGRNFEAAYGGTDPYRAVQDADVSPHFPYAAKIWSSLVDQRLGVQVDGVIAMDPVVLSRILTVIGRVRTPDGKVLTGNNLVRTLDVGVYKRFDSGSRGVDTPARKAFFVAAAQAVTKAALDRPIRAAALLHALARSAGERRLLVYSHRRAEETQLATTPLGGVLPRTTRPYAHVVVTNISATKLGYFLERSMTYQRSTCAATTSTVTFRLHNSAPRSGLPEYMTRGSQWGDAEHPPGSEYLIVSLYSTQGSSLAGATLDGEPLGIYTAMDRGHPVTESIVTIKPGQTMTIQFRLNEPAATSPVLIPVQPLSEPMTVQAESPACV